MRLTVTLATFAVVVCLSILEDPGQAQEKKKKGKGAAPVLPFPPKLPGDKEFASDTSDDFLKAPPNVLREGVVIAKTAPKVDFLYYPCQTYKAKIWSNWGDGLAVNGKYYSSLGDHDAPGGNAFVYEYDPLTHVLRLLVNLREILQILIGYTPGKIHGRLDMGSDGMLYFSTHRGSTTTTTDKNNYKGDWIIRVDPKTAKAEVVAHGPVPKHCLPCSVLDPDRLIFYAGTAPGTAKDGEGVRFLAYDCKNKKVLYDGPNGPPRYMIFARSSGKIYFNPGNENSVGELVCFDPAKGGAPYAIKASLGLRSATQETPQGMVYTVSKSLKAGTGAMIYAFNCKTETSAEVGAAPVGANEYITSIDADPTGRYLYYIPGAHGGAPKDGTPVVQFDVKTKQRKVIAFLHPFYKEKYGAALTGTFSTAVDPKGDKLYVTWNVDRGDTRTWDCCALTVIHIPESERQP